MSQPARKDLDASGLRSLSLHRSQSCSSNISAALARLGPALTQPASQGKLAEHGVDVNIDIAAAIILAEGLETLAEAEGW